MAVALQNRVSTFEGWYYLAVIMPFHRLIVPALLRQVAG